MTHALTTKLRLLFALDIFGNQVVPGELDLLSATNNFFVQIICFDTFTLGQLEIRQVCIQVFIMREGVNLAFNLVKLYHQHIDLNLILEGCIEKSEYYWFICTLVHI